MNGVEYSPPESRTEFPRHLPLPHPSLPPLLPPPPPPLLPPPAEPPATGPIVAIFKKGGETKEREKKKKSRRERNRKKKKMLKEKKKKTGRQHKPKCKTGCGWRKKRGREEGKDFMLGNLCWGIDARRVESFPCVSLSKCMATWKHGRNGLRTCNMTAGCSEAVW